MIEPVAERSGDRSIWWFTRAVSSCTACSCRSARGRANGGGGLDGELAIQIDAGPSLKHAALRARTHVLLTIILGRVATAVTVAATRRTFSR